MVVTFLTRSGCHLCDDALQIVTSVTKEFPQVTLEQRSVDDDPQLLAEYSDKVPVVLIDGELHAHWHVDADAFRDALRAAAD